MRERQTDTQTYTEKEAKQTLALEVLSSLRFSVGCCMWCRSCGGRGGCGRNFQKKMKLFCFRITQSTAPLLLARSLRSSYLIRKSSAQPETERLYVCRHSSVSKESSKSNSS
jgi:hypothetical protein